MRVVLDTNILFSALISPHGAPDAIYRAWRAARFEVVTSRMQLDEIRRASRYPKLQAILQPAKVGAMINNLQRAVVLERLTIEVEADDPDDSFLLARNIRSDWSVSAETATFQRMVFIAFSANRCLCVYTPITKGDAMVRQNDGFPELTRRHKGLRAGAVNHTGFHGDHFV